MIRSVLAILAGIVVLTVTSFAIEWVTDPVLARVLPDAQSSGATWHHDVRKLIMFVYTTLCVAFGGYVTGSGWRAVRGSAHEVGTVMGCVQMALTVFAQ